MRREITKDDFKKVTSEDVDKMIEMIHNCPTAVADLYSIGRMYPFLESKSWSKFEIKKELCTVLIMEKFKLYNIADLPEEDHIKGVAIFMTAMKKDKTIDNELDRLFPEE